MYLGENYMIKMRTDLNFLRGTTFIKILSLAKKRDDPLFILASVVNKANKISIPMRGFLKSRIVAAEKKIFEEKDAPKERSMTHKRVKSEIKVGVI